MVITTIVLVCMIILEFVLFTFSATVPNVHNGFYYFYKGIYFLIVDSRINETNACQGFVFTAVILCYLPSIVCAIILYFDITSWLIFDKIGSLSFFADKDSDKVKFYLRLGHVLALAIVFLSACSLIIMSSGYSPKIQNAYILIFGFISDNFKERFLGAICLVYYGIGFVCAFLFLLWLTCFIIYWIFKLIIIGFGYIFRAIGSIFKRKK